VEVKIAPASTSDRRDPEGENDLGHRGSAPPPVGDIISMKGVQRLLTEELALED
jgi:hypothetical protein